MGRRRWTIYSAPGTRKRVCEIPTLCNSADRESKKMTKKKNATQFPQGVFSLEQIEEQFANQWVLVEETIWDKGGQPLAGRVVAHSQEKATVVETGVQYGQQYPDVQLFLFYAGEKIPEGVVVLL